MVVLHDFADSEALDRRLSVRDQHLQGALKAESQGSLLVGGAILDNHEVSMKGLFNENTGWLNWLLVQ